MDGESGGFPTDAFAEILLRVPAASRRRLRLVCRHWRDVIDERAPAKPGEPKPLAYVVHNMSSRGARGAAYVFDDDVAVAPQGRCREVWSGGPVPATDGRPFDTRMVGTCNGLLCLCDNTQPGGAVTLVNPATRESLALPPLPDSGQWAPRTSLYGWVVGEFFTRWYETYGFVHSQDTGRYTVVHLPCYADRTGQFDAVRVFTLGEASWRDVPAVAASCRLDAGVVGVGGAAYWVTKGSERVMSFDAGDERVAPAAALPVEVSRAGCQFHLAEVRGRLGFVATVDETKLARVEVWVLGDGRDRRAWSPLYRVQVHGARKDLRQQLARPRFEFAHGQCVLTNRSKVGENGVFVHRLAGAGRLQLQCREVRINEGKPGTAATDVIKGNIRTFAYVETTEPLSVYRAP